MKPVFKLMAAALAIAACDGRRAGTEVGNPEMNVTAIVAAYDSLGAVEVGGLYMRMMGMNYAQTGYASRGDSGTCWKRPEGILLEFDSAFNSELPDTMVEDVPWGGAEIILRAPEGPAGLPDSAGIGEWSNPRYAKFAVTRGRAVLNGLFEMPQGMEIRLAYSPVTVAEWRFDGSIWVPLLFHSGTWAAFVDPTAAWTARRDGKGERYVLFSPAENAAAWAELMRRLPLAFGADTAQIR